MADIRKNHSESTNRVSEAARAGVREAADQTEDAMKVGVANMQRISEEFSKAFGFSEQAKELTERATKNLEAVTESGAILARGFQEMSREWLELTQERLQKNSEGLTKLAACRSAQDLAAVQSDLIPGELAAGD
jgi:hypothetical protein